MAELTIYSLAEDCLEARVSGSDLAHKLADRLREAADFEAVVPGLETVAVRFDPAHISPDAVVARMEKAIVASSTEAGALSEDEISVPMQYGGDDGPDFAAVCERTGLTADALIELHSQARYRVALLGFTPGFAYLSGLPERLNVPRLDVPRVRLPAGSVGITSGYCGLYAMPGPGGWSIIGRTDATLFDPNAPDPFRVKPGTVIRFEPQ